jgi:hypothetical protein
MSNQKTSRCDWSIGELTTATSGANERVGESLRRPARAGLGALHGYQLSITDRSLAIWVLSGLLCTCVCVSVSIVIVLIRVTSDLTSRIG